MENERIVNVRNLLESYSSYLKSLIVEMALYKQIMNGLEIRLNDSIIDKQNNEK